MSNSGQVKKQARILRYGPDSMHSWMTAGACCLSSFFASSAGRSGGFIFVAVQENWQTNRRDAAWPVLMMTAGMQASALHRETGGHCWKRPVFNWSHPFILRAQHNHTHAHSWRNLRDWCWNGHNEPADVSRSAFHCAQRPRHGSELRRRGLGILRFSSGLGISHGAIRL
ncbi:hypothetical protein MTO96_027283 [Rhipicephalus appendiculatus]